MTKIVVWCVVSAEKYMYISIYTAKERGMARRAVWCAVSA